MSPRLLRPKQSGAFDPRTISGLSAWIDFSDTATIGPDQTGPGTVTGEIGYVRDKFVSGMAYTQGTGASRPVLGAINGRAAADWGSGANSKVLIASNTVTVREVTAVFSWSAGGSVFPNFNCIYGNHATNPTIGGRASLNRFVTVAENGSETLFVNNTATNVAFPAIAGGDGVIVQVDQLSAVSRIGYIGMDRALADRGWRGCIGELLVYNRALTTAERAAIRSGLAKKWKITL